MRGIGKVVGPVGLLFAVTGLMYMGYDMIKALVPLLLGVGLVKVSLLDAFRWD